MILPSATALVVFTLAFVTVLATLALHERPSLSPAEMLRQLLGHSDEDSTAGAGRRYDTRDPASASATCSRGSQRQNQ